MSALRRWREEEHGFKCALGFKTVLPHPHPPKKEEKGRKTKEEESKARQTQGNVRY